MGYLMITLFFIALDFISGLLKAFATSTFSSQMMRKGFWHKVSSICAIGLGLLMDYAQQYLDLGMSVPVAGSICVYIILMEAGSTVENLCTANPELMPDKLCQICGIECKKEVHSTVENLCATNPELMPDKLCQMFGVALQKKEEKLDENQ